MLGIILPIILIVISLGIIGFLIHRTYPQLTLIKVDTIPEIKEAKKKYEMMKVRLEERSKRHRSIRQVQMLPLQQQWKKWQQTFRNYANRVADRVREERAGKEDKLLQELSSDEKKERAKERLRDAQRAREQEEYEFAEKCYIEAIRINPRETDAYRGLADVYLAQDQLQEAKETLHFLHQLDPSDDTVLLRLADIAEEEDDVRAAVDYYQQAVLINDSHAVRFAKIAELFNRMEEPETALEAIEQAVELEPQNPRYLDILVETAILVEQLELAEDGLRKLRTVNPDNQKIEILQDKIRMLSEQHRNASIDAA